MAEKYSFIVVRYPNKETAEAALEVVNGLAKEKVVKLKDAVALTKDEKGKIHMHQTKDDPASQRFPQGRRDRHHLCRTVWPGGLDRGRCGTGHGLLPCSTAASRTSCSRSWARR